MISYINHPDQLPGCRRTAQPIHAGEEREPWMKSRYYISLIVLLLFAGTRNLGSQYAENRAGGTQEWLLFEEVLGVVSDNYVDPIPPEGLVQGAGEGLVESMDLHIQLLDQRRPSRLMEQTK